ncbi:hypothetical protein A3721_11760 [Sulfitobacter sp. HI0023]|nr:hypothetical protein A3721_11760 [Sulfitobacter sp. HI0023]
MITDPLAQDNVVPTKPLGVEMVDLDDIPYRAEPQVDCAFCIVHRSHRDGYFAILSNGQRAPCGNCCAAKFDAVKKQTIDKNRNRLIRERECRNRARVLSEGVPILKEMLQLAANTEDLAEPARVILGEVLNDDARKDLQSRGVQGLSFLDGCRAKPAFARSALDSLLKLSSVSKADYQRYSEKRRQAEEQLRIAAHYHMDCTSFFAPANLAALERWALERGNLFGVKQFEAKENILRAKGPSVWRNLEIPAISPSTMLQKFCANPPHMNDV